jgi:hypothetical protein
MPRQAKALGLGDGAGKEAGFTRRGQGVAQISERFGHQGKAAGSHQEGLQLEGMGEQPIVDLL